MSARNEITGDLITSKSPSTAYSDGWDRIFGKKKVEQAKVVVETKPEPVVDPAQVERDELTKLWWKYCEKYQKLHILSFADWLHARDAGKTEPYLPTT
jgi:hypothetical protein